MKCYDKPVVIQYRDEDAKQWIRHLTLHAHINTTSSNEYTYAGASRTTHTLTFSLRYTPHLREIARDMQKYRIVYDGSFWRIKGYDDYALQHQEVKLVGEIYG